MAKKPVSQSNTQWVKKGDVVNGKTVAKGYLAQYGKPAKKVTARVKMVQKTGGVSAGDTQKYKTGRRVNKPLTAGGGVLPGKPNPAGGSGGGGNTGGGLTAAQKAAAARKAATKSVGRTTAAANAKAFADRNIPSAKTTGSYQAGATTSTGRNPKMPTYSGPRRTGTPAVTPSYQGGPARGRAAAPNSTGQTISVLKARLAQAKTRASIRQGEAKDSAARKAAADKDAVIIKQLSAAVKAAGG